MNMIGLPNNEAKMLQIMSAWEATFPEARVAPPQLVHWDRDHEEVGGGQAHI
jgi:hypothetical protein